MQHNKKQYIHSFSKRGGKVFQKRKREKLNDLLPALCIEKPTQTVQLESLFDTPKTGYALEIGFGAGEHLLHQAKTTPDTGFIGCEPYPHGLGICALRIDENKLSNIRLFQDDARFFIEHLPKESIETIYILFNDPWPKKKHHKRRLIRLEFLHMLAPILKPSGTLRIATDHVDLAQWIAAHLAHQTLFDWHAKQPSDWLENPTDHIATRYQKKALEQGRNAIFYNLAKAG